MGGRGGSSGISGAGLITDQSSNFGSPGTYELYRSGNLDAPNGMIFLSASLGESMKYGETQHQGTVERYQLDIKNPLVVSESSDRDNVIAAWKALHPGEDPGIKTSGLPAKKWQQMDKQNAKALADSPYDAIIYKKADGRHEVQIPKSSSNALVLKKKIDRPNLTYNKNGEWYGHQAAKYRYDKGKGWTLIKNPQPDPFTGKPIKAPKFIKE